MRVFLMKFDPFNWSEFGLGETLNETSGRLRGICSHVARWYVIADGYEVLAGVGTSVDLSVGTSFQFRVESDEKRARLFCYCVPDLSRSATPSEAFTNIDRQPFESGTMLAITKRLREHDLAQRGLLRQIRSQSAELERRRSALQAESVRKEAEDVSEPPVEPVPAPASGGADE